MDIGTGTFFYVDSLSEREQLRDVWHAITYTQTWDYISDKYHDLSMHDQQMKDIYYILDHSGSTNHSAASFAWCMKNMRILALYGEHSFQQSYKNV